jgi:hypothetical protein
MLNVVILILASAASGIACAVRQEEGTTVELVDSVQQFSKQALNELRIIDRNVVEVCYDVAMIRKLETIDDRDYSEPLTRLVNPRRIMRSDIFTSSFLLRRRSLIPRLRLICHATRNYRLAS